MTDFKPEPDVTQYVFEVCGNDLRVAKYLKGHQHPDMFDYLPGTPLMKVLKVLEEAGYAIRIHRDGKAQAIKDKVTRIDFLQDHKGGWVCKKYPQGWTASTPPISTKPMTAEQVAEAIQWCKDHKWIVREFPGGARAWRDKLQPVRDRAAILAMSRRIRESNFSRPDNRRFFDFAYDC